MGKKSVPTFDPKQLKNIEKAIETQVKDSSEDHIPQPRGIDLHKDAHILRSVLHFAAFGYSPQKVSELTGLTVSAVRNMTRSPSAQTEILRLQKQLFEKDFRQVFMQILPVAVNTAYGIMTSKKSRDSVKLQASVEFMDRALGKPKQTIENTETTLAQVLEKISGVADVKNDEPIEAEFEKMAKDNAAAMDSINKNVGDEPSDEEEDDELDEEYEDAFP